MTAARPTSGTTTAGPRRRPSRAARRRRRGRRLTRALLVLLLAVLTSVSAFVGGLLAAPAEFDLPPAPRPALLFAADGSTQLTTILPVERREPVPPEDIPVVMREAIISAEDARFLEHKGVDPLATVRAAYRDLSGGRVQGGSTLTQQYVKNVYVGRERTLLRKVREAALAVRLEQRLGKQQIITDYLNVLFLGNGTFGVQAASKYYFGVPVKDLALDRATGTRSPSLEIARAAMLAGIAPAPSAWNPVEDLPTARARQRYVLNQMVLGNFLSPTEASEAFGWDVTPVEQTPTQPPSAAPEFTDLVEAQLKRKFKTDGAEDVLFRGGLRVRTTLDARLQEALAQALREVLPDDDDPQAAAVAIDLRNGDVKAMSTLRRVPRRTDVTGAVREATSGYQRNGWNLATDTRRSTGSTIKPFTLATALLQGHSLDERRFAPACDDIADPNTEGGIYRYCNAAGEDGGSRSITLRQALAKSVNTVYVPLALEVGRDNIKQVMLDAGVDAKQPFSTGPKSFGLGTSAEVTPLSLANAYGTLMNDGVRVPPRLFTEVRTGGSGIDPGTVVEQAPAVPEGTRALPGPVAAQVVEAMSEVTGPGGTAPAARQDFPVFGKTGTTNDSTNAWFVGCARDPINLCVAIWMGYEETSGCERVAGPCGGMLGVNGVKQVYGGTLPARIFDRTWELLGQIQAAG